MSDNSYQRIISELASEIDNAKAKHPRDGVIPFTTWAKEDGELCLLVARGHLGYAIEHNALAHHEIIVTELHEAIAEADPVKRRVELIQVLATVCRAIFDLDAEIAGAL